jgi:transportin-3
MYARSVAESPLFSFAFDAVKSDSLFDAAVDVIQDLIHETQEVEDNVEVVQMIVPRVIELRSRLHEVQDDPDTVRGLCRIFAEAGETYQVLLLQHPETFLPLVETIGEFSAYPDLDIVPITFNFWWKLAQNLTERDPTGENPAYLPYRRLYAKLQDDMIRHLQFPPDDSEVSPAERDEFRSFRHYMGDTLKDCCEVLGADVCMKRSYELVAAAMNKPGGFVWQEIEAPLFSMRSMGARVDPNDDEVLPHIMDMLPQLPSHNKIRYAALLVISRYTEWIDKHPSYLEFQLNYISTGFEIVEDDVSSAAAQAMKFMCEDCKQHLVPYLPQLYSFITTAALKLPIEDRLEVAEAIGYVISHMPPNDSAMALQKFAQPLITQMQDLLTKDPGSVTKEEVQPALGEGGGGGSKRGQAS